MDDILRLDHGRFARRSTGEDLDLFSGPRRNPTCGIPDINLTFEHHKCCPATFVHGEMKLGSPENPVGAWRSNSNRFRALPAEEIGSATEQIHGLIEEDRDIAILVLAAGSTKEGPGPLVSSIAGRGAAFPIPVTVLPDTLSDEEIDALC